MTVQSETEHDLVVSVEKLIADLARPTYVYRMARANFKSGGSAPTRMLNAAKDIDDIVRMYGLHA